PKQSVTRPRPHHTQHPAKHETASERRRPPAGHGDLILPHLAPVSPAPRPRIPTLRDRSGSLWLIRALPLRPQRPCCGRRQWSHRRPGSTEARHPFDAMPPGIRGGKRKRAAPPGDGRCIIDALPSDVLHHVLSFLPAHEAVRTCVLARCWRHLWRSATGLRISCGDEDDEAASVEEIREFVDNLLRLRRGSSLDICELYLLGVDSDDIDRVNLWIRRVLDFTLWVVPDSPFELNRPFISQHLKKLQLSTLELDDSTADFSSCPALEVLDFKCCGFYDCQRISSQSLKCLSLDDDCSYDANSHPPHIYVPSLISLRLAVNSCRTPLLQRMPFLVEAVIEICCYLFGPCGDRCSCSYVYGNTNECMILQGLSEAQSLVLISDIKMTLLLNEYWCMPTDFSLLTCILQHSPVLEKLTLQLFCKGPKSEVEMVGSPDPAERSNAKSKHLKIVEVKCEVVDVRVLDVLKFLSKLS
ncbi:hypothetical protein U9M48_002749, partial [Paspalum notatum var. saurae]